MGGGIILISPLPFYIVLHVSGIVCDFENASSPGKHLKYVRNMGLIMFEYWLKTEVFFETDRSLIVAKWQQLFRPSIHASVHYNLYNPLALLFQHFRHLRQIHVF